MGRAYFPPTTTGSDDEPHFPSTIPQAPQVGGVSRIEMKTSSRAAWPHGVSRSEMKILKNDLRRTSRPGREIQKQAGIICAAAASAAAAAASATVSFIAMELN